MTILLDDLLIRPIVGFLDILHDMSIKEMYDIEDIQSQMKENRLLYEMGERPEDEFQRRKEELETQLAEAQEARENLHGKAEIIQ